MAERPRHLGWPIHLHALACAQVAECNVPECLCVHALLFVWPSRRGVDYELRLRNGKRFEGAARELQAATRYASATLEDEGFRRLRVVHSRPVEVPRA